MRIAPLNDYSEFQALKFTISVLYINGFDKLKKLNIFHSSSAKARE